jgi:hypothetical protein
MQEDDYERTGYTHWQRWAACAAADKQRKIGEGGGTVAARCEVGNSRAARQTKGEVATGLPNNPHC